ncbi:transposase IS4 family protein [Prevotella sp. CAG:924]|nr:transposase IS4 family protein [Prevotella sp. CAG:924]
MPDQTRKRKDPLNAPYHFYTDYPTRSPSPSAGLFDYETTSHLKSDYRLGRNFYKGVVEDTVNALSAATTYDFRRDMKALGGMIQKIYGMLRLNSVPQKRTFKGLLNKVATLYGREECRASLPFFPGRGRGVEVQGVTCPKWTVP